MLEGCYIVYNQEELAQCLRQLQQGIDPKADARREMVEELFGQAMSNPGEKMRDHLVARTPRFRKK
jgi:hypothetical protein